jgi:hypothetical protein
MVGRDDVVGETWKMRGSTVMCKRGTPSYVIVASPRGTCREHNQAQIETRGDERRYCCDRVKISKTQLLDGKSYPHFLGNTAIRVDPPKALAPSAGWQLKREAYASFLGSSHSPLNHATVRPVFSARNTKSDRRRAVSCLLSPASTSQLHHVNIEHARSGAPPVASSPLAPR